VRRPLQEEEEFEFGRAGGQIEIVLVNLYLPGISAKWIQFRKRKRRKKKDKKTNKLD
jgi:hypothetical protein